MQIIIYDKQNQQESFILKQKPLRQNQYYIEYHAQNKKTHKHYTLIKFIGIARPNLYPYDLFKFIAFPTKNITKQMIDIMERLSTKNTTINKQNFAQSFLGNQNVNQYIMHNNQRILLSDFVKSWAQRKTQVLNKKLLVKQMTYQCLSEELKKSIDSQTFQLYKKRMKNMLQCVLLKSNAERIKCIQQVCQKLQLIQNIKYYTTSDKKSTYLLLNPKQSDYNSKNVKQFTLAQLINKKCKLKFVMDQYNLQKISISIFNQIYNFKQKSNKNNFQPNKQFMAFYFVNPHNVFIRLVQNQNQYSLNSQNPCSLDMAYPFLRQLGLQSNISTIQQQILLCKFLHPILNVNKLTQSVSKEWKQDPPQTYQLMQCLSVIHWIGFIEYMCQKLMNQGQNQNRKSLLQMRNGSSIVKMINNHSKYLSNFPSLLLASYRMQFCKQSPSLIKQLRYQNFYLLFQKLNEQDYSQIPQTKFYKVELFIKFKEILFTQKQGLKYFIQKSKILNFLQTNEKYMIIYLICKYLQISIYKEILDYEGIKIQDLKKDFMQNKRISKVIGQCMKNFENILVKIEKKIEYKKESNQLMIVISKYKQMNIQNLCKSFQDKQSEIMKKLQEQNQILKQTIYQQFKRFDQKIRNQNKLKVNFESYKIYRKNLCFLIFFLELNKTNYAQFCSLYDSIIGQIDLTNEKGVIQEQIDSLYNKYEERIKECAGLKEIIFWKSFKKQ